MSPTVQEMQRQIHAFALAEMRNRGLEEAAQLVLDRSRRRRGREWYDACQDASAIRALKTNASENLTDWWADEPQSPALGQPSLTGHQKLDE